MLARPAGHASDYGRGRRCDYDCDAALAGAGLGCDYDGGGACVPEATDFGCDCDCGACAYAEATCYDSGVFDAAPQVTWPMRVLARTPTCGR